jgi:CMP-N-acetylneuraminic acid synthetase
MLVNERPVLALIPARGGSKGLIGKNMLKVNDIPLVGYSLHAALNSEHIDEVYLSSDDMFTLTYGKKMGVTPVLRPIEFSDDEATASDVVKHFLDTLPKTLLKQNPYIVYLQPTSPLRTSKHIDDALNKMMEKGLTQLISVVKLSKSPFKSFIIDKNGTLQALFEENMTNKRRQDLPKVYAANGAIYVFSLSDFTDKGRFPANGSYSYIMNDQDSLDIDNKDDLLLFKKLITHRS